MAAAALMDQAKVSGWASGPQPLSPPPSRARRRGIKDGRCPTTSRLFHLSAFESRVSEVHQGKCWPLTCPVFPLGLTSFRSHVVAQLEMGAEPWVPDRVDMTSAMARGAYRGPGSDFCRGTEGEESPAELSVPVEVSQDMNPKVVPSTQKGYPCDLCGLHLKDIVHPAEHQATFPRQKPHVCEAYRREFKFNANLHQPQMQQNVDKPIARNEGSASLVKSCRDDTSKKPFTLREGGKAFVSRCARQHPLEINSESGLYEGAVSQKLNLVHPNIYAGEIPNGC
eukprot:bmy_12264T0